jgi:hypothetical protein
MTIDTQFLIQTAVLGVGGGVITLVVFLLKRQVLDRIDTLSSAHDEMGRQNADDHRYVRDELIAVKTTVNSVKEDVEEIKSSYFIKANQHKHQ